MPEVLELHGPWLANPHPVEKLWREHGLPEWFLGNSGTNAKLYALYDAIRREVSEQLTDRITDSSKLAQEWMQKHDKLLASIPITQCELGDDGCWRHRRGPRRRKASR